MTQSVNDFLKQADNSLAAAELLLAEGFSGYAAARVYYTMFYVAQAFLSTRGLASSKHSGVVSMFGHEFAKSGIVPDHFHRYLIRAGETRLLADYRGKPIADEEAQLQIDRGREMLEFAKQFFAQYFAGKLPAGP